MNNVLFVDCCISQKGYGSHTAQLCRSFLSSYANSHPAAQIDTLDLKTVSLAVHVGKAEPARQTP